jgi:hypothetical protein
MNGWATGSLTIGLLLEMTIAAIAAPVSSIPSSFVQKSMMSELDKFQDIQSLSDQSTSDGPNPLLSKSASDLLPKPSTTHIANRLIDSHAVEALEVGHGAIAAEPLPQPATEQRVAQESPSAPTPAEQLNLDPAMIENSPVLQRWLHEIPDVRSDIRHDPSFRTRLRLGYSQFPSTDQAGGFHVGIEDVFLGRTGVTWSADYQRAFNGDREAYGSDLHYYVLPLGNYINVAPVIGYRRLETDEYRTDGINLGLRLMVSLSRTGAADISLTQSWISPGADEEVGMTTLSVGYAVTRDLRISADIQKQNAPQSKDSRIGIGLEWML